MSDENQEKVMEEIGASIQKSIELLQNGKEDLSNKDETLPVRLIECTIKLEVALESLKKSLDIMSEIEGQLYQSFHEENPDLMQKIIDEHISALKK